MKTICSVDRGFNFRIIHSLVESWVYACPGLTVNTLTSINKIIQVTSLVIQYTNFKTQRKNLNKIEYFVRIARNSSGELHQPYRISDYVTERLRIPGEDCIWPGGPHPRPFSLLNGDGRLLDAALDGVIFLRQNVNVV